MRQVSGCRLRELLPQEKVSDYPTDQIRLNPSHAHVHFNRGIFRLGKKDYDNAIAEFDAAIRLNPKDARAHYSRALAWKRKKGFDKAIADFNAAIQLDPEYAAAYNERAWLWATCTDKKFRDAPKAVESARKACVLTSGPKKASYLDTLAAAYAEAGDFAGAVATQAEANNLFAGNEQRKKGGRDSCSTRRKGLIGSERRKTPTFHRQYATSRNATTPSTAVERIALQFRPGISCEAAVERFDGSVAQAH